MPSAGLSINLGLWPNVASPPPYRLIVGGVDILTGTSAGPGGVPIDSLEWEYTSSGTPAAFNCEHWDPARAFSIPGHAEVRLWDQANDIDLFWGFLIARETRPAFATGRMVKLRAVDGSLLLDRNLVHACSFEAGLSDQTIIMSLFARFYHGQPLTISGTYIRETNTNMPAMTFEMTSFREAINQVAKAADADEMGPRFAFIDPQKRVQYHRGPFIDLAPYDVTDGTPSPSLKNVSDLELVYDDSDITTVVYVKGSKAAGTGYVYDFDGVALYGWRAEALEVPDSDTLAKRLSYGNAYLRTKAAPERRGSFTITGTNGWTAQQMVRITSTNLGLVGEPFDIRHVSVTVLAGTPVLQHHVEFGARRIGVLTHNVPHESTIGRTIIHT